MPIKYPDVSKDFPKLVRTLAQMGDRIFDYWDDIFMGIYSNSERPELKMEAYFQKGLTWVHLNKPYPISRELESDWDLIEGRYVKRVEGTKYKVDVEALLKGPLREYALDERLPNILEGAKLIN